MELRGDICSAIGSTHECRRTGSALDLGSAVVLLHESEAGLADVGFFSAGRLPIARMTVPPPRRRRAHNMQRGPCGRRRRNRGPAAPWCRRCKEVPPERLWPDRITMAVPSSRPSVGLPGKRPSSRSGPWSARLARVPSPTGGSDAPGLRNPMSAAHPPRTPRSARRPRPDRRPVPARRRSRCTGRRR